MFRKREQVKDFGLTLLEVLLSLVLTGVIAGIVLLFFINHYQLANELKLKSEREYALLRAGQVLASAVQGAERITWNNGVLTVSYRQEEQMIEDKYYLADKDWNGILDLYREHLTVPNPVASGLNAFNCFELQKGLWRISLQAGEGKEAVYWERIIKQKISLD
ncbi:MAG TPA: prepilin-type cleavage/methylation domain-containing protein [Peptococcaceae bacterium]|nr:prepilin-type cleavage/methylation domain-containing protein [Peptococcaceae bacterium]